METETTSNRAHRPPKDIKFLIQVLLFSFKFINTSFLNNSNFHSRILLIPLYDGISLTLCTHVLTRHCDLLPRVLVFIVMDVCILLVYCMYV